MKQIKVSMKVVLLALLPQLGVYKINKYTKYISKRKNISKNITATYIIVYCTSEIFNTAHLTPFSTTQYPLSIRYLPT